MQLRPGDNTWLDALVKLFLQCSRFFAPTSSFPVGRNNWKNLNLYGLEGKDCELLYAAA